MPPGQCRPLSTTLPAVRTAARRRRLTRVGSVPRAVRPPRRAATCLSAGGRARPIPSGPLGSGRSASMSVQYERLDSQAQAGESLGQAGDGRQPGAFLLPAVTESAFPFTPLGAAGEKALGSAGSREEPWVPRDCLNRERRGASTTLSVARRRAGSSLARGMAPPLGATSSRMAAISTATSAAAS